MGTANAVEVVGKSRNQLASLNRSEQEWEKDEEESVLTEVREGSDHNDGDDDYFIIVTPKPSHSSGTNKSCKKRCREEPDAKGAEDNFDWMRNNRRNKDARGAKRRIIQSSRRNSVRGSVWGGKDVNQEDLGDTQ